MTTKPNELTEEISEDVDYEGFPVRHSGDGKWDRIASPTPRDTLEVKAADYDYLLSVAEDLGYPSVLDALEGLAALKEGRE